MKLDLFESCRKTSFLPRSDERHERSWNYLRCSSIRSLVIRCTANRSRPALIGNWLIKKPIDRLQSFSIMDNNRKWRINKIIDNCMKGRDEKDVISTEENKVGTRKKKHQMNILMRIGLAFIPFIIPRIT